MVGLSKTVAVVVQVGSALREGWPSVVADIEASDIGKNYRVLMHAPGLSVCEHMCACLSAAAATGAELVLRLEDDVAVNRFILHNASTWAAVDDERFCIGWLFDPGAMTGYSVLHRDQPKLDVWTPIPQAYSQAVLVRSADVKDISEHALDWYRKFATSPANQDLALGHAARALGRQIAVHSPSLVEHRIEMQGAFGHHHPLDRGATSRGSFDREWRRGDPVRDRFGRIVNFWR